MIPGGLPKSTSQHLLILILTLSGFSLSGQGYIDLLSVEYFEGLNRGNYDRYTSFNTTLQAPIPLPSKDVILSGVILDGADIRDLETEYNIRNVTFNAGFQKQLKDDRSLLLLSINRFNSDQFSLDGNSYQFGFVGLYTYKKTEKASFQLGFYSNREFLGQVTTPLFGIDWKISPKIRFSGVLPAIANLAYRHHDKLATGIHFMGIFQTYRQPELGNYYVQRSVNQASLYGEYYFTKWLVMNLKVGYRVGSAYRLFREEDKIDWALNVIKFGDNREEISFLSSDQFIITASFKFRLSLED